jgi:exopolyphosphatase/pppGpp-phosphohydrolase
LQAEPEAAMPARLQGVMVDRGALRRVLRALRTSTVESLAGTPGIAPGRADVALSGAMVLREVLRALPRRAAEQWVVHLGGVREGLVLRAARALAARER